ARFNVADALYKNGKFDEAAALYRSLAADDHSPLAQPSRFNLGNTLFQKQDYKGAIQAYRDALHLAPGDLDTRRNMELALRALEEQQRQQQQQQQQNQQGQQNQQRQSQQSQNQKNGQQQQQQQQQQSAQSQQNAQQKTAEQREDEKFR